MLTDARTLPDGTAFSPDLAIIGGGPAGIALALQLADGKRNILLISAGGLEFDRAVQDLYAGQASEYVPLEAGRLRYLGGGTNHWGGWCRPLDPQDFEARDWVPHSGWPITRKALEPYYPKAQQLVEAGPWLYDQGGTARAAAHGAILPLGDGGLYTSWFQFSKTRGGVLPTPFGLRYADDLKRAPGLNLLHDANITAIRLAPDAQRVARLDAVTLNGKRITVTPRVTVLAAGGMENARLLLVSNDVMTAGIGNQNDLVGRFFGDNPVPRDVATLVSFGGRPGPFYSSNLNMGDGAILRAVFAVSAEFARKSRCLGSLTTVEYPVELDDTGKAAVATTAAALGVDASGGRAYSLGCGLELMPDPDRRLVLTGEKDALGMPRLKLNMHIADSDFSLYRRTLVELGRQLLASKAGMLRINKHSRADWMATMDWGHHHIGTTRMGHDPRTSVVDANLRVHGLGNLFVTGSSTFPTYGASNPTLNLIAVTLRLGDHLKKVLA